jgi:hypothetical protein
LPFNGGLAELQALNQWKYPREACLALFLLAIYGLHGLLDDHRRQ